MLVNKSRAFAELTIIVKPQDIMPGLIPGPFQNKFARSGDTCRKTALTGAAPVEFPEVQCQRLQHDEQAATSRSCIRPDQVQGDCQQA